MSPRVRLLALTVSLLGCAQPPPAAPAALDDNLRWFWTNGESADDVAMRDAATKLAVAGKADSRTDPFKGQMRTRLSADELAVVGLDKTNDPSTARGIMIVNLFSCTLDKLQAILIAQDQKTQYPGVYDSYTRSYTSSVDTFTAGSTKTLTWSVDLKASLPIDDAYTSTIKGGIRRVSASTAGTQPTFLVTRTWLPAPAKFSDTSSSYLKQDYQLEVFWEQSPGRIFHAYGMWREIKAGGFNLTLEDNGFMNIVLDNLVKWDDTTATLCAK